MKSTITRICSIEGCVLYQHQRQKWCSRHYQRWLRYRDAEAGGPLRMLHGKRKAVEYNTWASMKSRCYNRNEKSYARYGAKGTQICRRWRDSFADFYRDMGPRPHPSDSIDRIDSAGHYSCGECEDCRKNVWPANCRWATRSIQSINRCDRKDNTSGFRGVTYERRWDTWRARITFDGTRLFLGEFKDISEAANRYDQFAAQLHGDDAKLNFDYSPLP